MLHLKNRTENPPLPVSTIPKLMEDEITAEEQNTMDEWVEMQAALAEVEEAELEARAEIEQQETKAAEGKESN